MLKGNVKTLSHTGKKMGHMRFIFVLKKISLYHFRPESDKKQNPENPWPRPDIAIIKFTISGWAETSEWFSNI